MGGIERGEVGGVAYCHSMPADMEGKVVGRDERYVSMLARASIAEPGSTPLVWMFAYLNQGLEGDPRHCDRQAEASTDRATFDHIQYRNPQHCIAQLPFLGHIHHDRAAQTVPHQNQPRQLRPPQLRLRQSRHRGHILTQYLEAEVQDPVRLQVLRLEGLSRAMSETLISRLSVPSGIQGEDPGVRERLSDLGGADGEGEAGGAGAVVGHEERPFGARRREVDVVGELGVRGEAFEIELLGEEVAPGEGV